MSNECTSPNAEKLLEKGATLADILALFAVIVVVERARPADPEAATVAPPAVSR